MQTCSWTRLMITSMISRTLALSPTKSYMLQEINAYLQINTYPQTNACPQMNFYPQMILALATLYYHQCICYYHCLQLGHRLVISRLIILLLTYYRKGQNYYHWLEKMILWNRVSSEVGRLPWIATITINSNVEMLWYTARNISDSLGFLGSRNDK